MPSCFQNKKLFAKENRKKFLMKTNKMIAFSTQSLIVNQGDIMSKH